MVRWLISFCFIYLLLVLYSTTLASKFFTIFSKRKIAFYVLNSNSTISHLTLIDLSFFFFFFLVSSLTLKFFILENKEEELCRKNDLIGGLALANQSQTKANKLTHKRYRTFPNIEHFWEMARAAAWLQESIGFSYPSKTIVSIDWHFYAIQVCHRIYFSVCIYIYI